MCTERNHVQTSVLAVMFALHSPKLLKQPKKLKKTLKLTIIQQSPFAPAKGLPWSASGVAKSFQGSFETWLNISVTRIRQAEM